MKDPLFNFGFISYLASKLSPVVAQGLESFVAREGFDAFLCGYIIDPAAMNELEESVKTALAACLRSPHLIQGVKLDLLSKVHLEAGKAPRRPRGGR